jgi:hypothetical protein
MVEQSDGGGLWTVVASGVAVPSYVATGLANSTTYEYVVMANSSAGLSAASAIASATTSTASTGTTTTGTATDGLSIQPMVISVARNQTFSGMVATFADTNLLAAAGSFVAVIRWGDGHESRGTVTGSDGEFTVAGRHRYAVAGHYAVRVKVTMSVPPQASTSTISTAAVGVPLRVVKRDAMLRHDLARRTQRTTEPRA